MKRVVLILIFAFIFFTACLNNQNNSSESQSDITVPIQIAPEEEFDGVLFGMTPEEVINTIGSQPDECFQDVGLYEYYNLVFLGINADEIDYNFDDDKLTYISALYKYQDHGISGIEQLLNDYRAIQEELLKRYPGESYAFDSESSWNLYNIETQNRKVSLEYLEIDIDDKAIIVSIKNTEETDTTES